jgi:hypothetical protein
MKLLSECGAYSYTRKILTRQVFKVVLPELDVSVTQACTGGYCFRRVRWRQWRTKTMLVLILCVQYVC